MQFTFEKITCYAKREKKITCREEKNPSPPGYQMVRPLFPIFDSVHEKGVFPPRVGVSNITGLQNNSYFGSNLGAPNITVVLWS